MKPYSFVQLVIASAKRFKYMITSVRTQEMLMTPLLLLAKKRPIISFLVMHVGSTPRMLTRWNATFGRHLHHVDQIIVLNSLDSFSTKVVWHHAVLPFLSMMQMARTFRGIGEISLLFICFLQLNIWLVIIGADFIK